MQRYRFCCRMILLPTHDFCLQITPRAIPIKHFYLLQALRDKFVFAQMSLKVNVKDCLGSKGASLLCMHDFPYPYNQPCLIYLLQYFLRLNSGVIKFSQFLSSNFLNLRRNL